MKSFEKIFLKIVSIVLVNLNGLKYSEDTLLEFQKFSYKVQYRVSNVHVISI